MKRGIFAVAAIAALTAVAIAAADSIGTKAIKPVTATFTATEVVKSSTKSCTGPSGTISATKLDVNGTATSAEPALNGPVRLRLDSVVDGAKQIGTVGGSLRVVVPGGPDTIAKLDGVYSAGKLHGLLRGSAARPFQRLVANISGDISTAGVANGKIGATDSGGGALLAQPGKCEAARAQIVAAVGLITSLTDTSITAAGVSCAMTVEQRQRLGNRFQVGDRVKMTCRLKDGKLMLDKIARA